MTLYRPAAKVQHKTCTCWTKRVITCYLQRCFEDIKNKQSFVSCQKNSLQMSVVSCQLSVLAICQLSVNPIQTLLSYSFRGMIFVKLVVQNFFYDRLDFIKYFGREYGLVLFKILSCQYLLFRRLSSKIYWDMRTC